MKSYYDIQGDGGSKIVEQVTEQRARIATALGGVRRLVAVGSGKGGVGKSTLTLGLARALRQRDHRVAILDADLNGPSQARLAGLGAAPLVPAADGALAMPRTEAGIGVVSLGSLVPDTEAVDFDSVVQGDSYVWRATREFALLAQILAHVQWGRLDVLLVDLPPGAERTFQYAEFLGRETAFVLVTIPSDLAQSVVSRSVAALAKTPNPLLGYVENMSGYYCSGCGEVRSLFPEGRGADFGIACLGRVPFDPALAGPGGEGAATTKRALDRVAAGVMDALPQTEKEIAP
jgi:ATP-binding protein involved in chromosome partitioning